MAQDSALFAGTTATVAAPASDPDAFFVARNMYGRYAVPTVYARRVVPTLLARGEVYEPQTIAYLRSIVQDGDIVSGGAFVGDFFPALSAVLAPGAVFHSFEPMPLSYEAACRTIALNGLQNVRLHPVAVSDAPGTLPMLAARREGGAPLAAAAKIAPGASGNHVVTVAVTTLDALIPAERRVSVLHLDVEGHEAPALAGARGLIARNRPVVVLECSGPKDRRAYKRLLREIAPDAGYHVMDEIERNAIFCPTA